MTVGNTVCRCAFWFATVARVFTTREVAVALWTCGLAVWICTRPRVGRSARGFIRAVVRWKILVPVLLMAAYIALAVRGLYLAGLWKQNLLTGTILWFLFSGLVLVFFQVRTDSNQSIWRLAVVDQLKAIVLVHYLVNTYTFAFLFELLLVPVLTAVVLTDVVAKRDAKNSGVAALTTWLHTLLGVGILARATHQAVSHSDPFQALDALRAVMLPLVLSTVLVLFIYLLSLVLAYDHLLLKIETRATKGAKGRLVRKTSPVLSSWAPS